MRSCIFCKNQSFTNEIDLGYMHPSAFVPDDFDYDAAQQYELKLVSCNLCGFVQLSEMPPQDEMYRKYWYRSSLNSSMVDALADIIHGIYKRYPALGNGFQSRVLDIGSNDGTLLKLYPKHWFRVGVDPATNLRGYYNQENSDIFLNDYFSSKWHFSRKFDIITSIAMFYDLLEPLDFVKGIAQNLAKDGIWVCQYTDLASMLRVNAFDNCCHEHAAYWTIEHFKKLIESVGLEIFDIEYNDVNGCSIRNYVGHKGVRPVTIDVLTAQSAEKFILLDRSLSKLDAKIADFGNKLFSLLNKLRSEGKTVVGLGASTKGNTLLQTYGLNQRHLNCIGEVSKEKCGLFTVGSRIPIIPESNMFAMKPDYVFVLPWHFINNIVKKNQSFLENGGKFIVPLPEPAIIDKNGRMPL